MSRHSRGGEAGQIGGIEAVAFGMVVLVLGCVIVANAWGVIDSKLAASAAAREATRAFVEADPAGDPVAAAQDAARRAVAGHGRDPERAEVVVPPGTALVRCARVTLEVRYPVSLVAIPYVGGVGRSFTAVGRHSEIVDPYRSGLAGRAVCRA